MKKTMWHDHRDCSLSSGRRRTVSIKTTFAMMMMTILRNLTLVLVTIFTTQFALAKRNFLQLWLRKWLQSSSTTSVWPDWAIFKSSWQQICLQKVAQNISYFLGCFEIITLCKNCFGIYLGNFWKHLRYIEVQYLVTLDSLYLPKEIHKNL